MSRTECPATPSPGWVPWWIEIVVNNILMKVETGIVNAIASGASPVTRNLFEDWTTLFSKITEAVCDQRKSAS